MKKIKSIFIGGKSIGYQALSILIRKKNKPNYFVGNLDDSGKDNIWHKSSLKLAKKNKIKIVNLKYLNKEIEKKKLKGVDIVFCIGSTQIISNKIINLPRLGCLNFHPSLLPKYRGRYSTVHSIFNGDKITGVTAHWIGNKIDSGNIIAKKIIKINSSYTAKDLYEEFTKKSVKLFLDIFKKIQQGKKIKSYKISNKRYKYLKKSLPNKGEINWNWKGGKILNFIKCMTFEPFAPPNFYIGKRKFVIIHEKHLKKINFMNSPQ